MEASIGGRLLRLSRKEFELLEFFVRHPDAIHSAQCIWDAVWGTPRKGNWNHTLASRQRGGIVFDDYLTFGATLLRQSVDPIDRGLHPSVSRAEMRSASGSYRRYDVAHWRGNTHVAKPFLRWDYAGIPARGVVKMYYQLFVRPPRADAPVAGSSLGGDVRVFPKSWADAVFASYPSGGLQ